jgi:hypothetical protein
MSQSSAHLQHQASSTPSTATTPIGVWHAPATGTRVDHRQVALAWHDSTCPQAEDCHSRDLHAATDVLVGSGIVERFLSRLDAVLDAAEPGPEDNGDDLDLIALAAPDYYLG